MGLPYPGGPIIDQYAKKGDPEKFKFPEPSIPDLDFSFSGLKTSFLYFIRDMLKKDPDFIEKNISDLCASIQFTIINILLKKLLKACDYTGISTVAIAGGVSANSSLRRILSVAAKKYSWQLFIPRHEYTTDNAAMIAITGYFKYMRKDFTSQRVTPYTRS